MTSAVAAWPKVALGEVLIPVSRPVQVSAGNLYPLLGMHWYAEGLYIKDRRYGAQIQASTLYVVKEDDFVYNRLFGWKGSFGLADAAVDGCFVSNEFPCFRVSMDRIASGYLRWYFTQSRVWDDVQRQSSGSTPTSRLRLKEPQLLAMQIPLPPLDEQRRIVARIETLAARIAEARGLRREAEEEAEGLTIGVVSSISFPEQEWTTVRHAASAQKGSVRSGPFGSQLHHDEFTDSGIAAIGTRDVQVNRFTLAGGWYVTPEKFEEVRRYQVKPGDVLATIVGASIGRFCVVPDDVPMAFTTKHVLALTLECSIVAPRFVSYILNYHNRSRSSLFAQVEGSAQPSLNSSKILDTAIPLPSLKHQERIVAYLDDVQSRVDTLKRAQAESAAELDALLPAVLDRAFRGAL